MGEVLGHVIELSGSQLTARVDASVISDGLIGIGQMVRVGCLEHAVIGAISAIRVEDSVQRTGVFAADLFGEIVPSREGAPQFRRGLSRYPGLGAPVFIAEKGDLATVYAPSRGTKIRVGTMCQDPTRPALIMMNELLAKHFAVIGTSGSGKSCAVALILSAMLAEHPGAHIVLLDPHNEYAAAFGDVAEVINVANLQMPFWLLDFEEAVRILVRGGTAKEQEAQALILKDAIVRARRQYAGDGPTALSITVDTPVPFRLSDLLRCIYEGMGSLERPDTSAPYLRLKTRLESLRDDKRFAFMFSERLVPRDTLSQFVGRMLRIPPAGKPVTVIDLSGLPSEVTDVVVSLACRIMFDFVLWSEDIDVPPILLVCEEAHRYTPADERVGFAAAARAITRLAKEGRKYGISLCLVSQRPSELSPDTLSQCGTIFSLRLGNEVDQRFVAAVLPDAAQGMLAALPTLGTQEVIISGEAVALPMRVRFDDLPVERRPSSGSANFSEAWRAGSAQLPAEAAELVAEGIRKWRLQTRSRRLLV
jgi:uncharacterized protein